MLEIRKKLIELNANYGLGWTFVFLALFIVPSLSVWYYSESINDSESYLFSLERYYVQYLKEGNVNGHLKNKFEDNQHSLSNKARVSKIDEKKWEIVDSKIRYRIEDIGTQLNIYSESINDSESIHLITLISVIILLIYEGVFIRLYLLSPPPLLFP